MLAIRTCEVKLNRILKWLPAMVGVVLFVVGLVIKIAEHPINYDQFISNNSYILMVIGAEAVILNLAFTSVLNDEMK